MKKNKHNDKYPFTKDFLMIYIIILLCSACSLMIYLSYRDGNLDYFVNDPITDLGVLGYIAFAALILTFLINLYKRKVIIKPLEKISDATKEISNGNLNAKIIYKKKNKITYSNNIYENFNKMVDELNSIELLKSDFISIVSHEIKTPLSIIQSYSTALQDENITDERKNEYLKIIVKQTEYLSRLIGNILKINKLENQEIVINKKKYFVSEQIRESIISMDNLINNKNIKINIKLKDIIINNDPDVLILVWNNLISNAIKYTDYNGEIKIRLKEQLDNIIFTIEDNGCGIDQKSIKHIYDKFYQGDTSRSEEGNGLGLALVYKALKLIDGTIEVESKLGVGTKFTITLKK